ncbi:MAG: transporter [Planctomycetota bacterium]
MAVDDGARAYWKAREGTEVVSFQALDVDIEASGTQQFGPGQYIYPNADVDADLYIVNWVHFFTVFNRPSSLNLALPGGNVDVDFNTNLMPPQFLPPGVNAGDSFSQSSSGFADPTAQWVINLFGTPPLRSNVDLLNYEPTWTLDVATMLAFPIGEYDEDKLVNLGQNRWLGRVGLPLKYHFGVFTPGYRKSLEIIPSVWLFDDNDDFLGKRLENDPMWQLEAHLTSDFTPNFYGSLDALYRNGFQSEIDGVEAGDDLDVGSLGFTLNYQVSDNFAIRAGYSSDVFGDSDLDTSMLRIQFVFGWHQAMENFKKLTSEH